MTPISIWVSERGMRVYRHIIHSVSKPAALQAGAINTQFGRQQLGAHALTLKTEVKGQGHVVIKCVAGVGVYVDRTAQVFYVCVCVCVCVCACVRVIVQNGTCPACREPISGEQQQQQLIDNTTDAQLTNNTTQ